MIFYDLPEAHVYSVLPNKNFASDIETVPTEIKVIRLDTLIRQRKLGKIDVMKIDVEEYEPEVVDGLGSI